MAYLRKEKETVEIDYPMDKVWEAIPKVLQILGWAVEEIQSETYQVKARTNSNFMAYSSVLVINVLPTDEKTVRVVVAAETPVTTITSLLYFGRVQERINRFLEQLERTLSH